MNCPKCNDVMEDSDNLSFACNRCAEYVTLCRICKLPNQDKNSDICGHPSCIERKMRYMFKEAQPKKERKNEYTRK